MRVTTETKTATRERILAAAAKLFTKKGWEETTTRDIAVASGVATGTLFNYFQTKEAIMTHLMAAALSRAERDIIGIQEDHQNMGEALYSFIYSGLKALRNFRGTLASAAETIFSPLVRSAHDSAGDSIRIQHLEKMERILGAYGIALPLPAITMQLYWTLYLGIFAFWAADESPHQEDTLALLDRSLQLFLGLLSGAQGAE